MTKELPRLANAAALKEFQKTCQPELALRQNPSAPPHEGVTHHVMVCGDTGCFSAGGKPLAKALEEELTKQNLTKSVRLVITGCHGFCDAGPLVTVYPNDFFYTRVKPEDAAEIVESVKGGKPIDRLFYREQGSETPVPNWRNIKFYAMQNKITLRNCGHIDPARIEEYIAGDGYLALAKALEMKPEDILNEVKVSGLRGRGGGGFPAGIKWELCRKAVGDKKYILCNADEGDPGAFMDRAIFEGDPHRVVEGMIIGALAIGSDEGYVYVRAEYPGAIRRLRNAIAQAEQMGLLGDNILGSGKNFTLHIKEGAGAFVCGEETALIRSIEGQRGVPTARPPFPAVSGLWDKPTNNNNVETWANIPDIILQGGEWFKSRGTPKSTGTKVFALAGKIKNTGLAEVAMGITIRDIVFGIGGGIMDDKPFKAVQIGGPSGGCMPTANLDMPVDYDSLTEAGAMMGSGGLVTVDEDTCMVDLARFFLAFTQAESCGKCTPCREGTTRMLDILNRITSGTGKEGDIEMLEELARSIKQAALCGLGQTAPNPVLSTLRYFRNEYEAHIYNKKCPARSCAPLLTFTIDKDKCNGCGACAKVCPVSCVEGDKEKKEPHFIIQEKCIKCGSCEDVCRKAKAVNRE